MSIRLEERCPCGGEMVLLYDTGNNYSSRSQLERTEAHKQLDNFRRRHKDCLKARAASEGETP